MEAGSKMPLCVVVIFERRLSAGKFRREISSYTLDNLSAPSFCCLTIKDRSTNVPIQKHEFDIDRHHRSELSVPNAILDGLNPPSVIRRQLCHTSHTKLRLQRCRFWNGIELSVLVTKIREEVKLEGFGEAGG